jgi:hypothetical protein
MVIHDVKVPKTQKKFIQHLGAKLDTIIWYLN